MSRSPIQTTSVSSTTWRNVQIGCAAGGGISLIVGVILLGLSLGGVFPKATTELRHAAIAAGVATVILAALAVYSGKQKSKAARQELEAETAEKGRPNTRGNQESNAAGQQAQAEIALGEADKQEDEASEIASNEDHKKEALRGEIPSNAIRVVAGLGEVTESDMPKPGEIVGVKRSSGEITYAIFQPPGQEDIPSTIQHHGQTCYNVLYHGLWRNHVPLKNIQRYDQAQIQQMSVGELIVSDESV